MCNSALKKTILPFGNVDEGRQGRIQVVAVQEGLRKRSLSGRPLGYHCKFSNSPSSWLQDPGLP